MLPFLSIVLTGIVITSSFLLISSARDFITSKNKEFLGGDISYSSSREFRLDTLLDRSRFDYKAEDVSEQITFSGLIKSGDKNSNAEFKIIDNNYPLYGKISLKDGVFGTLGEDEVYIDEKLYETIGSTTLTFNNKTYNVKGVITSSPESLISGLSFTGKILMSKNGLNTSGVDLGLFRKEFVTKVKLDKKLDKQDLDVLKKVARDNNVRSQFDGSGQGGIYFGLDIVERFLVITILVITILSLVNIYSSVNYLATRLRRSFAILTAIGLDIRSIYKIFIFINSCTIFLGTAIGILSGYIITIYLEKLAQINFDLFLRLDVDYLGLVYIFCVIFVTSFFATLPIINRLKAVTPKELLSGSEKGGGRRTARAILFDVLVGILPVSFAAIYLLDSFTYGILAILAIIGAYGGLMFFYYYLIDNLYKVRDFFNFSLRLIVAQKKFDGFFGLVAFASLFIALASVYSLSILRTSIDDYLKTDLSRSIPSTYVLDVQSSQMDDLLKNFPELNLFPNVRARIAEIDGTDIQKALEGKETGMDRELGREFNLTYRDYLLPNEKSVSGDFAYLDTGTVSVEKDFAERANIRLGSYIKFIIQGIDLEVKVVNIREVDTRSGYPFFYFILDPKQLSEFPKTFFGYSNIEDLRFSEMKNYLSQNAPNVSVINTSSIKKTSEEIVDLLILIILLITVPSIILSCMLIVTILSLVSKDRKRDGARLAALGKENKYIRNFYILESSSTVIIASVLAYIFALVVSNFVIIKYLKINNLVYLDTTSLYISISILFSIFFVSLFLWRKKDKSLREYLNYEENN